jgi:hypothetical protein
LHSRNGNRLERGKKKRFSYGSSPEAWQRKERVNPFEKRQKKV